MLRPFFTLAFAAAITTSTLAGPLTPPAGAPAPTHKTLTEVEPRIAISAANTPGDADSIYRITNSGSYYLTENLTGVSGKRGIEVANSFVTIDLNGFTMTGVTGSLEGIRSFGGQNVVIHSGTILSWGDDGIDCGFNTSACRVYDVYALNNGAEGIKLFNYGMVERCTAAFNTGDGIRISAFGTITNCVADSNGSKGINATNECVVTDSYASRNQTGGFNLGVNTIATNCAAYDNSADGFFSNSGGILRSCASWANDGDGFQINQGSIIQCVSSKNLIHGFYVFGNSIIRENNASDNTSAGFFVQGANNRIEDNHSTLNDVGYRITGAFNLIIRNYAATSTTNNYVVGINNRYGKVVDWTTTGTPAFTGNSSLSFIGTTDPFANYAQ